MSPALTPAQRHTLAAALERVLPGGGDGPGATDAHAIGYAEFLLRHPRFAPALGAFETGLGFLDTLARALAGHPFAACAPAEQDAVLAQMQRLPHPSVQRFFVILVRMALDGFLGAPTYGGNRDGVGWRFVGFTPHPMTTGAPAGGGGAA